jgi:hypothetical protein
MEVGPYLHASRLRRRVQRMASEDSVENLIDRTTSLLSLAVHRVSDFDDRRQPTGLTMQASLEKMHRIFEQLHVGAPRRELHVSPHERQHMGADVRPRVDREHKNVGITWLWPDPSALEHILHHFEQLPTSPVLIHEKLRLDVEAEGGGRVPLDGETPAALTLHNASCKPASRLCSRQSFLLIVRTRHIVTVSPAWDGTRSAGYSDVPAYS